MQHTFKRERMQKQHYDIIGDIHGHADELIQLLELMGYSLVNGYHQHPTRKVIFLGDFVDRGLQQRLVLETVMPMVKHGSALAIMGNHEFNALAYHTPKPNSTNAWLRPRNNQNSHQHLAFLQEYLGNKNTDALQGALDFFYSLPLWLDLPELRVVHACWEPYKIKTVSRLLTDENTLDIDILIRASTKGSDEYHAVEALLKGVEYTIPNGGFFHDKDGHKRHNVRTRWWINQNSTLKDVAFIPPNTLSETTAKTVINANDLVGYPATEKPVFVGHYWMQGTPQKLADNVACLDYSVAKNGKLVAYQWQGEAVLNDDHFIYISQ
ncbi:MAG: hypothetical protein HN790_11245 [Methylococcales bacterium]|nr:hypothetical protein [Methylococcales bacterium]